MIKKIMGTAIAAAFVFLMSGCTAMKMGTTFMGFEPETQEAYAHMMEIVDKSGDPAKAMMLEYKVADDVTNEDVGESIHALAEEYNMRITGDVKMFTKEDAKPDEVKHARIFSLCSLHIAKVFLNHSRYFGGFMPCRIMLVEYGNGDRYLITMDLTLAIYGGKPLPDEMLKLALKVKKAMEEIPQKAANGDF